MPQQISTAIYDVWDCSRTRVCSPGVAMMPLAGVPPQRSIPVVLDGGVDYEIIKFVAGRWGAPPVVPAPTTTNQNRIFLGGAQYGGFPIVSTGGFQFYRIGGTYLFGIIDPEGLLGDFMLGSAPMPNQPYYNSEMLPANYIQPGMVNSQPSSILQHVNVSGDQLRRHLNTDY